ncbi:MAG TPA: hypothetical protein VE825_00335 [Terriglobales bacterium]|jgi:hypothetical protein|nr:hypothetical protein [Terriglobales bacterium]
MRAGTESRNKVIAAAVMAALAIILFVRMIVLSSSSSAASPVARPQPQGTGRPPAVRKAATAPATATLDPTLRLDLLQASEATQYEGSGRNIFRAYEPPPPVPVVAKDSCVLLHPGCPGYVQPPPPPPPITLKFFGFASRPGEAKKVFLADGDNIFVGKEGDIVNRRYKILKISANSVEVEDILNNNRQVIFMSQGTGT